MFPVPTADHHSALVEATSWASDDERILGLVLYGSLARGTARQLSDIDLLVVTKTGARDDVWADRAQIVGRILRGAPGFVNEPLWQRSHRYQAWRNDLVLMLDLTFDEGEPRFWRGLADGHQVLADKSGLADRLATSSHEWTPTKVDAASIDESAWPWLDYLVGQLDKGHLWAVRFGLHDFLNRSVLPLLAIEPDQVERALAVDTANLFTDAAPRSSERHELRRACQATLALYEQAMTEWAIRTGHETPTNPLAERVRRSLS